MVFPFLTIVGIILFLYLTWRNLRDNYKAENLITYSWLALMVFLVGGRITYGLANWGEWGLFSDWILFYKRPGINLAGGYVVLLMLTNWLTQKYGWKVWPFLEDMTDNMIVLVFGTWMGGVNFNKAGAEEGITGAIFVFCWWVSRWVRDKYRSFVWYKSGRKGFGFFFANMVFFLLLSVYFLMIGQKIIFGVLLLSGLINLGGLFILGEVLGPLLINLRKGRL